MKNKSAFSFSFELTRFISFIECNLPVDLCEYSPNPDACKEWLEKNHPDFHEKMNNLSLNGKIKSQTLTPSCN